MLNKKKNNKGFTLVELLVVIAIIGILAVVAVPALFKNINKAKVADVESDYSAIKSAVLSYYTDKNTMPISDATTWNAKLADYMDSVPTKSAIDGTYSIVKSGQKLALKIEGAKATGQQMVKLIDDIGSEKVYFGKQDNSINKATGVANGDNNIYLILVDNTNM